MNKALIIGVSGQDGAYLSKSLLAKGYRVFGSSREINNNNFTNLKTLDVFDKVSVLPLNPSRFSEVFAIVKNVVPDEIYNLAGQSSVSQSFLRPLETIESIASSTVNLLEAVRISGAQIRFYSSVSSDCFGGTDFHADESTSFNPKSPYAIAKAMAFWATKNYRLAYGIFACSGILFNHESPLRNENFVTGKIINTALRIKNGSKERLKLGDISVIRDWGWAEEFVESMWLVLQQKKPDDFVIATGESNSLEALVREAFLAFGLNWKDHVDFDASFLRPLDIKAEYANPAKASEILGWKAKFKMRDVVHAWGKALGNI
ncbi:MAG TPA: GDP-mannose 4,6-dehydratase [Elusimicrobia bacterium]|nr:GDP-mannose 4,6-dehydratase [Elusimicrobiota bacterium]